MTITIVIIAKEIIKPLRKLIDKSEIELLQVQNLQQVNSLYYVRNKCSTFVYTVLINLVMISVWAKGVLPELIGAASLFILYICSFNIKSSKTDKSKKRAMDKWIRLFTVLLFLFFGIQIIGNRFGFWQLVNWRGTTRCTFALLLVWFCVRKYFSIGIGIHTILPLLIVMNISQLIYIYTDIAVFDLFQASHNYLGAVDIVVLPFVFRFSRKVGKVSKTIFFMLTAFIVFAMGSRSIMFIAAVLLLGMALLEKNKKLKRLYFVYICLFVAIIGVLVLFNNPSIMRALKAFSAAGRVDGTRETLINLAKMDFHNKSVFGQLFGNGVTNLSKLENYMVHNFFWEIMLAYGNIGCALWFVFYGGIVIIIFLTENKYKWYLLLFGICSIVMNYFQPFITSGFLYQFLFFFGCCEMYLYGQSSKKAVNGNDVSYFQNVHGGNRQK